jgi:hypothetical protein
LQIYSNISKAVNEGQISDEVGNAVLTATLYEGGHLNRVSALRSHAHRNISSLTTSFSHRKRFHIEEVLFSDVLSTSCSPNALSITTSSALITLELTHHRLSHQISKQSRFKRLEYASSSTALTWAHIGQLENFSSPELQITMVYASSSDEGDDSPRNIPMLLIGDRIKLDFDVLDIDEVVNVDMHGNLMSDDVTVAILVKGRASPAKCLPDSSSGHTDMSLFDGNTDPGEASEQQIANSSPSGGDENSCHPLSIPPVISLRTRYYIVFASIRDATIVIRSIVDSESVILIDQHPIAIKLLSSDHVLIYGSNGLLCSVIDTSSLVMNSGIARAFRPKVFPIVSDPKSHRSYLDHHQPCQRSHGYDATINIVAYNSDFHVLASADDQGMVCLWSLNPTTYRCLLAADPIFPQPINRISDLILSPNARQVLVCYMDRLLLVGFNPTNDSPPCLYVRSIIDIVESYRSIYTASFLADNSISIWRIMKHVHMKDNAAVIQGIAITTWIHPNIDEYDILQYQATNFLSEYDDREPHPAAAAVAADRTTYPPALNLSSPRSELSSALASPRQQLSLPLTPNRIASSPLFSFRAQAVSPMRRFNELSASDYPANSSRQATRTFDLASSERESTPLIGIDGFASSIPLVEASSMLSDGRNVDSGGELRDSRCGLFSVIPSAALSLPPSTSPSLAPSAMIDDSMMMVDVGHKPVSQMTPIVVGPIRARSSLSLEDQQRFLAFLQSLFVHDLSPIFLRVKLFLTVYCAAYRNPSVGLISAALETDPSATFYLIESTPLHELFCMNTDSSMLPHSIDDELRFIDPLAQLKDWLTSRSNCRLGKEFWLDISIGHNHLCALHLRYCGNKSVAMECAWQEYLRVYGPMHLRNCSRGLRDLTHNIRKIDETVGIKESIPLQIGYISGLQEIYARRVGLRGCLPDELGELSHLRVLSMGNNRLCGQLPPSLGLLTNLQRIVLHQNCLTGRVPDALGRLGCIVNLAGNLGLDPGPEVPSAQREALIDIFNATSGRRWNTKTNWLTSLPVCNWYKVGVLSSNVHSIVMSSNGMDGRLPASIGKLSQLRMIELATMPGLIGPIPVQLCSIITLRRLCICRCGLSGSIPEDIGKLVSLEELQLFGNNLTGTIPASLGNLKELKLLSLGEYTGGNAFTSAPLPFCLSKLKNLEALFMANCNLKGSLPFWIAELTGKTSD